MMRQTLISAVMLTLAFLAGGSALHAADAPIAPPEGMAIYIVVLHHGSGAPEADVAALGGRLLESRLNRRVVMLPTSAADTLRTHEKVAMLQRIWSGESFDTWRDDGPAGRAPLASARAEAYAPAPTSGSPSWTRTYSYDGSGNITASGSDRFWYDTAGRLAKAQVNTTTEVYGYDPFGNLTWQSGGKPFTVDANTNRVSGVPYDAVGNVTGNGAGREYHYDAAGMMAGATRAAGLYDRMIYTPDDERIAIATRGHANPEDNRTTFRVRDFSGKVLREWEQQGTGPYKFWQRDYMYAAGTLIAGDRAVATTSASGPTTSGLRHFHLDHLGSTRLITRADAVRISTHDYLPFGAEATSVIQEYLAFGSADPLKFTGHERDYLGANNVENDDYLDYMHARFYDGGWGRFLSVDPLLDIDSALKNPQEWNRYSYVTNNPLKYTDPDGKDKLAAFLLGAAGKDIDTLDVIFDRQTIEDVKQGARTFFAEHNSMFRGLSPFPTTRSGAMMAVLLPGIGKYAGGAVAGVTDDVVGVGFKSFDAFKKAYGAAGQNQQWHHIVEQTAGNVAQFGQRAIHNTGNLIKVSTETHRKISAYYSSKQAFAGGLTVRQWLSKKSIKEQYEFGMQVLRNHGVVK